MAMAADISKQGKREGLLASRHAVTENMKTLAKIVFTIPVLGWLMRSAWHGDWVERLAFVGNMVLLWIAAIYHFGYPAFIVPALALVWSYLFLLVAITAADLISREV
jgi:hypothetical protein